MADILIAICSTISAAGIIFTIPSFLLQLHARNLPVIVLIVSLFLNNTILLLNVQLWSSSNLSAWPSGLILCDIEIKLLVLLELTQTSSLACIFRQLTFIFNPTHLSPSRRQRLTTRIFETTLLFVLPGLRMLMSWVVSPVRFAVIRVLGCHNYYVLDWRTTLTVTSWPVLICLVAGVYAGIAAFRAWKHQREVAQILGRQPAVKSRTQRLFVLAVLLWFTFTPLKLLSLVSSWSTGPLIPWNQIHGPDWSQKFMYGLSSSPVFAAGVAQSAWSAVVFFCLGCGWDAMRTYKGWWKSFLVKIKSSWRWVSGKLPARQGKEIQWCAEAEELGEPNYREDRLAISELESIEHVSRA